MKKGILVGESWFYVAIVMLVALIIVMNFNISDSPSAMAVGEKECSDSGCSLGYCKDYESGQGLCVQCTTNQHCKDFQQCINHECV